MKFYQTSWAINPLSGELNNALSAIYLRDAGKNVPAALEVLREAVRDFPENPNHWNNYGYALSAAKRWPEAEDAYTRALSIAPDMALAERNLAGLAALARRPRAKILDVIADMRAVDAAIARRDFSNKTIALAASVARRAPGIAKARFVYGSLLLQGGRPAEAIPELAAAVQLDPARVPGRVNLGNAYLSVGRRAEAEAQYRAALSAEPGNPAVLERLKAIGAAD